MNEFQWELAQTTARTSTDPVYLRKFVIHIFYLKNNSGGELHELLKDIDQFQKLISLALHIISLNDLPDYIAATYVKQQKVNIK